MIKKKKKIIYKTENVPKYYIGGCQSLVKIHKIKLQGSVYIMNYQK